MKTSVSKAIGQALHEEMERDKNVILLGEDVGVMYTGVRRLFSVVSPSA